MSSGKEDAADFLLPPLSMNAEITFSDCKLSSMPRQHHLPFVKLVDRYGPFVQKPFQKTGVPLQGDGRVENIPRAEFPQSIPEFLRNDFRYGVDGDFKSRDCLQSGRIACQVRRALSRFLTSALAFSRGMRSPGAGFDNRSEMIRRCQSGDIYRA